MKTKKLFYLLLTGVIAVMISACKEDKRFEIYSNDKTPPGKPTVDSVKQLYGGARLYFRPPSDEDVLSVNAEYTAANGKLYTFSASYFNDSLDVYGIGDTLKHTINLYALDRGGNKSEYLPYDVYPLEPVVTRVEKSLKVVPGFGSFYVDWYNELMHSVNIYVDFSFTQNGEAKSHQIIYSSLDTVNRHFIKNLTLSPTDKLEVSVRVEDLYGNTTAKLNKGPLYLLQDEQIDKSKWTLPETADSIAGVPQCFGNAVEGRIGNVIDGLIDSYLLANYMHTGERGIVGKPGTGGLTGDNVPWSYIIDLGDYYELSRVLTHQRHGTAGGLDPMARGQYYHSENVGKFNLYYLAETPDSIYWVKMSTHKIPHPKNMNDMEIFKMGRAGDMSYMYPDDPQFSPPTRWFRYEAVANFDDNYTGRRANCLSEISLYGRKSN
ncbi:MAG: DUF4959 domain-containing protein [Prevotellaceae bacterium]|jgi:hypothetical protein|nr:DUF4959 domain-containing protein [Prevotellaceae bacterium]